MYLVHDGRSVLARGFPTADLAFTYAHAFSNILDPYEGGKIKVTYEKFCNLTRAGCLVYVGQSICPFTGESTSKMKEGNS